MNLSESQPVLRKRLNKANLIPSEPIMLALSQTALIVGFSALQDSQMEGSRRLDLGPGGGGGKNLQGPMRKIASLRFFKEMVCYRQLTFYIFVTFS